MKKTILKTNSKKTTKNLINHIFSQLLVPKLGHWGGVLELTFWRFFQLWAILGPKCFQELPQEPPDLHFYRFLISFGSDFDDFWTT